MIFVCIPVHDEASTIGVLLWKTRKVLGEFDRDYRVIVHDDASSDDTAEVLERYRRSLPLTVLRSEDRVGYGASVEKLLRHVVDVAPYPKRDCAVVLQGDFTEDPQDMVGLVRILEGGSDIVAGQVEPDADSPSGVRWARWLVGTFLGGLLKRAPVSDPLSGLRAYRVIVLKKAFRDRAVEDRLIEAEGWAANVELLGKLSPFARRIAEVPHELRYELQARPSRLRPWKTFLGLLRLGRGVWPEPGPEVAG